jgi:hypothetical protein
MGYTTDFTGQIAVTPPLNSSEVAYLKRFADTRRMKRENGPYYTGTGFAGQDREADIIDYNQPPDGQPGLWCQWEPIDDGTAIEWNGVEKFYDSAEWMTYLIDTFLKPGATASEHMATCPLCTFPPEFKDFTFDHVLNGEIEAQGEDPDDHWFLVVQDNQVTKHDA